MKQYAQKPDPNWWKQSMNSTIYHIREFSAILILIWAAYALLMIILPDLQKKSLYIILFYSTGFLGALIHTSTWIFVMPKTLPFKITEKQHIIIFIFFLLIWIGISLIILSSLWTWLLWT